ncbi:MAG: potassium-transporting ATPase subunit KdpC [Candidatus Omnitrophica bacterium]|nr:potassium-transporting ATPase subunit KdpC [Candidatus Omnitrophota bacterium]MDE2213764.1 potassium-transporting ATPase subunit KdpC [Candidatus Omnitrophota bacterium]MDE2230660.1 potassium-transporting ATPase subunit KdpC [Candidatus Omnitrophota bacterium]
MFFSQLRPTIVSFILFSVLTGIIYPLVVTGIAQTLFHKQAEGSLIYSSNGKILGSTLIGQDFSDPKYFWGRISATIPAYNASSSTGSNFGPTNPALLDEVKGRIAALKAADPGNKAPIPVDLVTSSGSGLDPDISLAAARYQLARVARVRGMSKTQVRQIVNRYTQGRFLDLLGEPVVNVLQVNIALDHMSMKRP